MGLKPGSSGFSIIKITVVCHVHNVACMYCGQSVTITTCLNIAQHAKIVEAFVCILCVCVCGRQKPKDPQFEPHGWQHHYTRRYTRSGISLVYLWCNLNLHSYTPRTLRACRSQSKFRILKIRESSAPALFLYNCTPNISRSADVSVSVA